MRELHHPGSDWYGCKAYGVVDRCNGDATAEGCSKCKGGEKYYSCCGKGVGSGGCAVKAAWQRDGPVSDIEGRWRSTVCGMLSIKQSGRTVSILCPTAPWSPTSGVVSSDSLSLLGKLGILRHTNTTVSKIDFNTGSTWKRISPLDADDEATRRVLCSFFHRYDRSRLHEVDDLVEQFKGRKMPLRDALVEHYRKNKDALTGLDELFGTAPKWWHCSACHDIMNAAVFTTCSVCGCENKGRKAVAKRTDDASPHFFYPDLYEMTYKKPSLDAPPAVPHPDELVHQLTPSLLSLGILPSEVPSLMKSGWADNAAPIAKKYVASRMSQKQGDRSSSTTLLKYGTFPLRPVLRTQFKQGDPVFYTREGSVPYKATVLFAIELEPVSYVIQFPDGREKVVTGDELTRARAGVKEELPEAASYDNGLPSWHPGSEHRRPVGAKEDGTEEEVVSRDMEYPSFRSRSERDEQLWSETASEHTYELPVSVESKPSTTWSEYGGAKWICFDCEFRNNPSEERSCLACGKRRNVGNWRLNKEEPAKNSVSILPLPASIYLPPTDTDAFQNAALSLHNDLRVKHQVENLCYDSTLAVNAQKQAELCARLVGVSHGHNEGQGQNTFMSGGLGTYSAKQILEIACQGWYQEVGSYKKNPGLVGLQSGAGHFTQMVWKGTKSLGAGVAWSGSRVYVVVNYKPPGNEASDPIVLKNVFLEEEPVGQEQKDG